MFNEISRKEQEMNEPLQKKQKLSDKISGVLKEYRYNISATGEPCMIIRMNDDDIDEWISEILQAFENALPDKRYIGVDEDKEATYRKHGYNQAIQEMKQKIRKGKQKY